MFLGVLQPTADHELIARSSDKHKPCFLMQMANWKTQIYLEFGLGHIPIAGQKPSGRVCCLLPWHAGAGRSPKTGCSTLWFRATRGSAPSPALCGNHSWGAALLQPRQVKPRSSKSDFTRHIQLLPLARSPAKPREWLGVYESAQTSSGLS
ncbi:uncharacterized protein LOC102096963 isoform X2 [Columba livia]|uniref:uncharacterized protein LOC102096963 isoform X2 n=1 Tax=Columba livia TaxID=8932 RepID=UPI0031BA21ED